MTEANNSVLAGLVFKLKYILLQVNGKRLLGLNHKEVVGILKELPQNVRLVCARRNASTNENYAEQDGEQFQTPPLNSGVSESVPERLVKSKSDNTLSETVAQTNLSNKKSRSLEPLTGLAMWSNEPVVIELRKGDKGLGFSILDYQVSCLPLIKKFLACLKVNKMLTLLNDQL